MSSTQPTEPAERTEPARQSDPTRNRLLAALVALMALACVLLALLLVSPSTTAPAPQAATVTVTADAGQQGQTQRPSAAPGAKTVFVAGREVSVDAKGYGPLGDRARRQDGDPTALGKKDAPVVLVEWADYACPFCAVWARDQQKQLMKYVEDGTLRIEWRDLVIFGEKSQRAAQAARAAGLQGKYWEFHEALFAASPTSGHPDLDDANLEKFARTAGVPDLARWKQDMESEQVVAAVRKDTAEAQSFGASSTPVFSLNGAPLVGAQPAEAFTQAVGVMAALQPKRG